MKSKSRSNSKNNSKSNSKSSTVAVRVAVRVTVRVAVRVRITLSSFNDMATGDILARAHSMTRASSIPHHGGSW